MLKKFAVASTSALFLLANAEAGHAIGPGSIAKGLSKNKGIEYIVTRQSTLAPFPFIKFCKANPSDCRRSGGPDVAEFTQEAERELRQVNNHVNRAIRAINDSGPRDTWDADVAEGDCEDFALTKRRKLISLGWSPRTLRIAVARTGSGEGHAVLVVKTSKGDLVLDNRTSAIKGWRQTDLSWVKIQSGENPKAWHSL